MKLPEEHAVITANNGRTAEFLFLSGMKVTVKLSALPAKITDRMVVGAMFEVNYLSDRTSLRFVDRMN